MNVIVRSPMKLCSKLMNRFSMSSAVSTTWPELKEVKTMDELKHWDWSSGMKKPPPKSTSGVLS